ncbi:riboflavin synthase, alpha subunit [Allokutzneria albata]|uniref:Riboflavin synthase n=1 Tax=Allokutzneria albata TaxID=211114 RepID=A0A1G9SLE8_ALLAB|nr:riboflavin synthase, alpha subunit [Allokutzneria albata]
MFTGRIGELGAVEKVQGGLLHVRAPRSASRIGEGGSVCVNGVRLTVRPSDGDLLEAVVSEETQRRSTFDTLVAGAVVNVETPLRVGDPVDGHLVQGCVDAVGKVVRVDEEGAALRVWIRPPARLLDRLLAKSPIALDGVSVTIAEVLRDRFSVVLVPFTRSATTLGGLQPGDRVNLEPDLVSRLAERNPAAVRPGVGEAVSRLPWAGHVGGRAGVEKALSRLADGGGVLVWDPDTEGEGDVVFAGARLRPESFTFLLIQVCGFRPFRVRRKCCGDWRSDRCRARATARAPRGRYRSTWRRGREPGCRPPNARPPCGSWPIRTRSPATSCGLGTSSRWPRGPGCSPGGPGTPRRRWPCASPRAFLRSGCAAR